MLMNGEGVKSPVGLEDKTCEAGLSLKPLVGKLTTPPGAVSVSLIAEASV